MTARIRLLALGGLTAASVALTAAPAAPASAAPPANGHDCAGAGSSALAGPGFGQLVAGFAHQHLVDDFGLADCGQTNRQNP